MKITIIGNSVALRVRPPEPFPANKNYTYLLQEAVGIEIMIENIALGASTISNWLDNIDSVINSFPDIYIIHIGVVDATVREVPLWFYRLATRRSDRFMNTLFRGIYRGLISKFRPVLSRLRGKRSWTSLKTFTSDYERLIHLLLKDTNAQLITLPINLANERIEKQLPGSRKNHHLFNEVIKKTTEKYHQHFLDISDLQPEEHYPDGVHFNASGHTEVAKRLKKLINEMQE